MTPDLQESSVFEKALHVYDDWSTQAILYGASFVLSLGTALLLDIKYHVPPGRVLLYVLPLAAISLVALPAAYYALRRAASDRAKRVSISDYLGEGLLHSIPGIAAIAFWEKDKLVRRITADKAELVELVRKMEELTKELERIRTETASSKKVFVVRPPYSPTGKGRSGYRQYKFSRPDSEGYRRA